LNERSNRGFLEVREATLKRTIGLVLAGGLAVLAAGCTARRGGVGGAPIYRAQASTPAEGRSATASAASQVRDFNLRVKCPGVHLAKTDLKWSDARIMKHYGITKDQIAECEAWQAAQPKGYVPPPPSAAAFDGSNAAPQSHPGIRTDL
jgi:hypothetical protein